MDNPRVYGYMRAYDGTPEEEIGREEERMRRWAEAEGYDLVGIRQETQEGGTGVLNALVEELNRTRTRSVVVPSFAHLGTSRVLQDHLWAHVVWNADAEVHEANKVHEASEAHKAGGRG